jgi:hypothetical protein
MLMANTQVFAGWARPGQSWSVGARTVRLNSVDEKAGTAEIQIRENERVLYTKTVGPVQAERLIEDNGARKALLFEHDTIAGFLVPWPTAFKDGQAQLKIYSDVFSLRYGTDYVQDPRFVTYPIGCPTGHNFGVMWTNKEAMTISAGGRIMGPENYFAVVVDETQGNEVLSWHVEDRQGNRTVNLGGPGISNIDLVLGQGRIAGQSLLKDIGRSALQRLYTAIEQREDKRAP